MQMLTKREQGGHTNRQSRLSQKLTKHKIGYYIMTKGSTHHEALTVINMHTPDIRTPKCMK